MFNSYKLNYCRDRYFRAMFPKGPRNRKVDLPEDWFKDEMQLFLSRWGAPLQGVNMDHFSTICDIPGVVAGDFRKVATTSLAHNRKQVWD